MFFFFFAIKLLDEQNKYLATAKLNICITLLSVRKRCQNLYLRKIINAKINLLLKFELFAGYLI